MSTSRRDFLKCTGITTLALLATGPSTNCNKANAISNRTSDKIRKREYVGRVRIWDIRARMSALPNSEEVDVERDIPVVYLKSEDIKVQANSAKNAYKLIHIETYKKFPKYEHFVEVEQISLEGKVVYHSVTDESGSLLAGAFSD